MRELCVDYFNLWWYFGRDTKLECCEKYCFKVFMLDSSGDFRYLFGV